LSVLHFGCSLLAWHIHNLYLTVHLEGPGITMGCHGWYRVIYNCHRFTMMFFYIYCILSEELMTLLLTAHLDVPNFLRSGTLTFLLVLRRLPRLNLFIGCAANVGLEWLNCIGLAFRLVLH
ncbi:hypothetical protein L9F63_002997, partial [Diploptera punctata]